jgi:surface-anchored protein
MQLSARLRGGVAAGVLALVAGLMGMTQALAADPVVATDPITLETGHIDAFNLVLNEDDSVRLTLKEDVTGSHVLHTPESVEMMVKPAAKRTIPAGFGPPGMPREIYFLPLTQDHNLIWPGWDTQAVASVFRSADTDIVVSAVDGPGDVYVWSTSAFGGLTSLMKDGGHKLPNTIAQPYPAHTHANWGFTEAGTYKFTVRADVRGIDGNSGSSNTATYTFTVAERTRLTPDAPTQAGNVVTIPDQKWMTYTDDRGTVLAAGERTLTEDLTVKATPVFGFDLAVGATDSWTFDHVEAPAEQRIAITGLCHHYHQNATIVLTAVADPAADGARYEWFLQRKDQDEPQRVAGQAGPEFRLTAEQALDGAKVTVNLIAGDGDVLAAALAVTIDVDDHGAAPLQQVTISGAQAHYRTGDTAELTAGVAPSSVLDRFEWFVQREGETEWSTVGGVTGADYSFEVTKELDGARVKAHLVFDDGSLYVASEPVGIVVGDHQDPGGDGTTPGGDGTTPGGDGTTPGGGETTPGGGETTPGGDGTSPGGDETTPRGDPTPPVDDPSTPSSGDPTNGDGTAGGAADDDAAGKPGSGGLADTGANASGSIVGGAFLLVAAGAAALIIRRRRVAG